ncbi:ABC transporter substrate-binding protein [Halobaculum lipolyticum]|uniref:ABC transporter substrate-binding protein n=1 Tax=Halobaculum lipolyticum TaxID=3032001 RepID=A0ABD5W817_9EURY|nr:ABC transporter substrate-binding protein [Halobaculum sp. DT31]
MTDDETRGTGPTRRAFTRYGGAVVAGGLLAGCTGESGGETADGDGDTADATPTPADTETATATPAGASYAASMAPVGEVTFSEPPSSISVYSLIYADTAVAYGYGDAVNSLGFDATTGGATLDAYYERLDGVSFDYADLTQLNSGSGGIRVEKELLYELDSDLHLIDPALIDSFDGWEPADVEEIAENVGPWFGNTYSRTHGQPPTAWRDDYDYYTLWQIAERVADLFGERDRYEALAAVHDDLLATVEADLPPASERPSVATVIFVDGTFYPSKTNAPGFANAHVRPLGAVDAFADTDAGFGTTYDYETLLEVDPDVILHQYGINSFYDVGAIRETIANDPVGEQLSAVQNDRVYASATPVQGPLMNLFQLEMTAKQLYPERFGAWPGYTQGEPYPEIPEEERLFDRDRVANAVAGAE